MSQFSLSYLSVDIWIVSAIASSFVTIIFDNSKEKNTFPLHFDHF